VFTQAAGLWFSTGLISNRDEQFTSGSPTGARVLSDPWALGHHAIDQRQHIEEARTL
jgi:hypothetical protein